MPPTATPEKFAGMVVRSLLSSLKAIGVLAASWGSCGQISLVVSRGRREPCTFAPGRRAISFYLALTIEYGPTFYQPDFHSWLRKHDALSTDLGSAKSPAVGRKRRVAHGGQYVHGGGLCHLRGGDAVHWFSDRAVLEPPNSDIAQDSRLLEPVWAE
jgi:hypothetical protein